MVLQELAPSQGHKVKSRHDLEAELFGPSKSGSNVPPTVRDNEGEAAEHGIYFDDTEYDYMQHVRDLNSGNGDGESFFVEAAPKKKDGKGKSKLSLEEALRNASLAEESQSTGGRSGASLTLDKDLLPSQHLKKMTYQDQQDVPDALAGFQPDMDPRLREVLEALDDEAYVDDEEEFFGEISKGGKEVSLEEFEDSEFWEDGADDAGWESDETEKPGKEYKSEGTPPPLIPNGTDTTLEDGAALHNLGATPTLRGPNDSAVAMEDTLDHGDGEWMKEFSKFKQEKSASRKHLRAGVPGSSVITGTSMMSGRRKRRKGAMTASTNYSMTSSSLARTEGLTLLDARFDKIEEDYAEDGMDMDDGTASVLTGSSVASSQAPPLTTRSDFDSIMDDFLGGYSMSGKKRVKKGGYQSGIEQLDELRKGLGPARIPISKAG